MATVSQQHWQQTETLLGIINRTKIVIALLGSSQKVAAVDLSVHCGIVQGAIQAAGCESRQQTYFASGPIHENGLCYNNRRSEKNAVDLSQGKGWLSAGYAENFGR